MQGEHNATCFEAKSAVAKESEQPTEPRKGGIALIPSQVMTRKIHWYVAEIITDSRYLRSRQLQPVFKNQ